MTSVENVGSTYWNTNLKQYKNFIEFHKLKKNTCNYNIKEVRSDNGLEYNNSNFINYLKKIMELYLIIQHQVIPNKMVALKELNQTLDNCAKNIT